MTRGEWAGSEEILDRVRSAMANFIYGEQAVKGGLFDETEFKEIRDIFNADNPPLSFDTPGDYTAAFKAWFSSNGHLYANLKSGGNVSITRTYPLPDGGTISLCVGGNFHLRNEGTLARTLDSLISTLDGQYYRIMAKNYGGLQQFQKGDTPGMLTAKPRQLAQGEITVKIDYLDTLYMNNRKMVRAFGGEFMRYGIPVYNEVLKPMGREEATMQVGDKIPINKIATVLMGEGGKPKKVTGWWGE